MGMRWDVGARSGIREAERWQKARAARCIIGLVVDPRLHFSPCSREKRNAAPNAVTAPAPAARPVSACTHATAAFNLAPSALCAPTLAGLRLT